MATILSKFSPLPLLPIPNDDDEEFSYSFQTDISFANEYTGPSINVPRANPLKVDEIPTAHPLPSSSWFSGLSYHVVQPLVSVTKKPPDASPSVVLRLHHVVSGSSSSSSPSESEVNANRVRFVNECDESSYMTDENSVAAIPRAERKGKKGSSYRCLMGNMFTEKEVCIVCEPKSLSPIELSLGKCSRMLKHLLTDSELQKVMHDEVTCKANQLYAQLISVNGRPLSEEELDKLQTCPYPPKKLKPGDYWYDKLATYWGKVGEKPCQIISYNMNIGGAIMEKAINGDTEIFINSREITKTELMMLKESLIFRSMQMELINRKVRTVSWGTSGKRGRFACDVLSLPFPQTSSAVEPTDEHPIYNPKMLNRLLLIGNEKCGATTIYKQARSLYEVPFTKDELEKIKFIIQTNLYAYLAMVLEAHEEEMDTNQADTEGETSCKTVSSMSPRLKHFSDWLLKEKEEGNLKIFPASSRENAQTVADLWRVPAIQATYKRLRDTLPRTAVYFLGRIFEISRSEYDPSDIGYIKS
ncbi:hypothetical protein IGI04_013769 [Brassica rapa subsp. trilocularis]|uniref:Uncharacterized protein n=1 Tax=Brassica rapa subsp. trilocularis TaxID=1813537 RepID=A0ABQ7NC62_BRACM|nr:hypothetical protein IGI04_013769 [Brassica rapa subsp. trilocularis]